MNFDFLSKPYDLRKFEEFYGMGNSGLDGLFNRPSLSAVEGSPNTYQMRVPAGMTRAQATKYLEDALKGIQNDLNDKAKTYTGETKRMPQTQVLNREFDDFNIGLMGMADMSSDMRDFMNQMNEEESFDIETDDHSEFCRCAVGVVSGTSVKDTPKHFVVNVEPDKVVIKRRQSSGYGSYNLVEVAEIVYKPETSFGGTVTSEKWAFTLYRADLVAGWTIKG